MRQAGSAVLCEYIIEANTGSQLECYVNDNSVRLHLVSCGIVRETINTIYISVVGRVFCNGAYV